MTTLDTNAPSSPWLHPVALMLFAAAGAALVMTGARGLRGAAGLPAGVPAAEKMPATAPLPDFGLVDSAERKFTRKDLAGKTWIFDFVFTHCSGPCPMMSSRMGELQKQFAANPAIRLATITVDPERDTPRHLAQYAKELGARPDRWIFLTGGKEEIFRLSKQGFRLSVEENKPEVNATATMPLLHSTRLILVDSQSRVRGYYDATDAEAVGRLMSDARSVGAEDTP
ncbi:MAG: SCO family protein [Candidatus Wallbacteria bacterium]|nr:SCO family protein [Candidatus Wallbacteria bacterium]